MAVPGPQPSPQPDKSLLLSIRSGDKEWLELTEISYEQLTEEEQAEGEYKGCTPLHFAVINKDLDSVKGIIKKAGDRVQGTVQKRDRKERTPLHHAAAVGNVDIIEEIMENAGVDDGGLDDADADGLTPFLTAAKNGHRGAVQSLLGWGDDKEVDVMSQVVAPPTPPPDTPLIPGGPLVGKNALFLAVEGNHTDMLKVLLAKTTGAQQLQSCDAKTGNYLLHEAASRGFLGAVKLLLGKDCNDTVKELLQGTVTVAQKTAVTKETPVHLAAKNGHADVLRELLSIDPQAVDEPSKDDSTPLHLASEEGRESTVALLLLYRDKSSTWPKREDGLTPLHLAAQKGHCKVVERLVKGGMVDPMTDAPHRMTPLRLAAKAGYVEVVNILLGSGANPGKLIPEFDEPPTLNALDLAITEGWRDVAMAIVCSTQWRTSLRNCTGIREGRKTTPFRRLIVKMPDVAKKVLDNCGMKSEDGESPHEFLQDFRDSQPYRATTATPPAYAPVDAARPDVQRWGPPLYDKSSHPLSIMVRNERKALLQHPVVNRFINCKWATYGIVLHGINLIFFLTFLTLLTAFALTALNPKEETCQRSFRGNISSNSAENCGLDGARFNFIVVAAGIILFMAVIRLLVFEIVFQLGSEVKRYFKVVSLQQERHWWDWVMVIFRCKYLHEWVNWLELALYSCTIVFTLVFHSDCWCHRDWQWEFGIIAVFLAWINLVLFLQKLPILSLYVSMLEHILFTFLEVAVLAIFLVLAFAFALYMAFFDPDLERSPFSNPGRAIIHVIAMTTGGPDDSLFRVSVDGSSEGEKEIPFVGSSYIIWVIFVSVMAILLLNLLISLAVGEIQEIREAADLRRIKLKVDLVLAVEASSPTRFRRFLFTMDANLFDNKVEEDNNSRSGSVRDWLSAGEFWQRLWTFMFWPAGHEDDAEKKPDEKEVVDELKERVAKLEEDNSNLVGIVKELTKTNGKLEGKVTALNEELRGLRQ